MRVEPSYAELMRENQRLRAALTEQSDSSRLTPSPRQIRLVGDHEERLYQVLRGEPRRERISSILQVVFPSKSAAQPCLFTERAGLVGCKGVLTKTPLRRKSTRSSRKVPRQDSRDWRHLGSRRGLGCFLAT